MSTKTRTDSDEIPKLVKRLRAAFDSGRTRPEKWRVAQLRGLEAMARDREKELIEALHADLGKPALEAWMAEVGFLASTAAHTRKKLPSWMKPERVWTSMAAQPGTSRIVREPLGVALIIAPWNYPILLALDPLVGALSAGNCAIVKPSEMAPHTSAALARLIPEFVDPDCVAVVEGAVPETTQLLAERFDHVFYTGNGTVGRIVLQAAAKHLTPTTLELGGKSPCIVDRTADLDIAARRIVFGKFYNAGQTCVAPDYLLVEEVVEKQLLEKLRGVLTEFYGPDPKKSADYGRIVNTRHHQRLVRLLDGAGEIVAGGQHDEGERYFAPTIVRGTSPTAKAMSEEIFGPILPVLTVQSVDAAIQFINQRDKPLALYVFSSDTEAQEQVLARTSSGGATVNHVWLHLAVAGLPFGGVGASGMGAYHGRHSFETFSHRKAVLRKPTSIDPKLAYPPYDENKVKWIKRLL